MSARGPASASTAPPNLVSPEGALDLQRSAGNQAVQRAFTIQRDELTPPGDNPIVGLKRQDGLDLGTIETRPRVKLLQTKLNQKTGSSLSVDGKWGAKTSKSLESFMLARSTVPAELVDQDTGDALMDRGGGVVPPKPKPSTTFNPVLESHLEAVLVEYQMIFSRQKDAIHRLESDLADLDKPEESLAISLMRKAVDAVMEKFISLSLTDVTAAVSKLGGVLDADQQKSATDGALGKATEAAKLGTDKAFENPPTADADAFIDTQLEGSTSAAADVQEEFLLNTKPAMSRSHDGDEATDDASDPRVARADALRAKIRSARFGSFDQQYQESLSKWSVYLEQKSVNKFTDSGGTDLSTTDAKRGILQIGMEIDTDRPDKKAKVDTVKILGLSEKARKRIKSDDRSIFSLGFPMIAERTALIGGTDLKIARNENDEVFDRGCNDKGKKWLTDKVKAGNVGLPDGTVSETVENGIRATFSEVEDVRTGKLDIEKG